MTDAPSELSTFLINLDRSKDRLAEFDSQARAIGLRYERFCAVDGREGVPEQLRSAFCASDRLSNGEVGCYASHLLVATMVVERKCPAAIVLEDDAVLDHRFLPCAKQAIQSAPPGWDIIHFSTDFKRPAYRISVLDSQYHLVRHSRLPANTAGYAISLSGARKLSQGSDRNIPIDMEFRYAWRRHLDIYGVFPAPVRQRPHKSSTIDGAAQPGAPASPTRSRHQKPDLKSQVWGAIFVARQLGLAAYLSRLSFDSDKRWLFPDVRASTRL